MKSSPPFWKKRKETKRSFVEVVIKHKAYLFLTPRWKISNRLIIRIRSLMRHSPERWSLVHRHSHFHQSNNSQAKTQEIRLISHINTASLAHSNIIRRRCLAWNPDKSPVSMDKDGNVEKKNIKTVELWTVVNGGDYKAGTHQRARAWSLRHRRSSNAVFYYLELFRERWNYVYFSRDVPFDGSWFEWFSESGGTRVARLFLGRIKRPARNSAVYCRSFTRYLDFNTEI